MISNADLFDTISLNTDVDAHGAESSRLKYYRRSKQNRKRMAMKPQQARLGGPNDN